MPQSHGIPHKCGDMPGNGANFKLRQQRVQEWLGIVQKQRFRALGQFEPDIIREEPAPASMQRWPAALAQTASEHIEGLH